MSERYQLIQGDCVEKLKELPENSVDAIVTDPPAGIAFMSKDWDKDKGGRKEWIAWMESVAKECLRVIKPGGHALVWAIPRTSHWTGMAWEDAGWNPRDKVYHAFGSGFPKSMDIGKALDRMDAVEEQKARRYRFTEWVRSTGVTSAQIDEATGTFMGGHYTTAASQPAIMTREHLEACRHLLGIVPKWVEREADIRSVESKNFAEREVVGVQKNAMSGWNMDGTTRFADRNITTPATEDAKQWHGWGTALKPAIEEWWLFRKPFKGTVAGNVLEHGTGALNIDGCRVEHNENLAIERTPKSIDTCGQGWGFKSVSRGNQGRWPAHFTHDGSDEVVGLFPETGQSNMRQPTGKPKYTGSEKDSNAMKASSAIDTTLRGHTDSGSAARFFYCAKPSKRDRNEGCESNHHPTVKATRLMTWLCRLITPPQGTILDPFTGSGSTGKAAMLEGFNFIGIEQDPEYMEIAKARIEWAKKQGWAGEEEVPEASEQPKHETAQTEFDF